MFFCGLCEIFKENHLEHCGQLFLLIKNFLLVTIQPRRGNSMPVICSQKSSLGRRVKLMKFQEIDLSNDFVLCFVPLTKKLPLIFS